MKPEAMDGAARFWIVWVGLPLDGAANEVAAREAPRKKIIERIVKERKIDGLV